MIERLIGIILLTLLVSACSPNAPYSRDVERQLEELDRTIDERDRFEAIKTQYIGRIKAKLTPGCTDMQRYGIYDNLYDEYYQYNLDSATFYARVKLDAARRIGSPSMKFDAMLDMPTAMSSRACMSKPENTLPKLIQRNFPMTSDRVTITSTTPSTTVWQPMPEIPSAAMNTFN